MMQPKEIDWGLMEATINKHRGETWALIPLLQEIQEVFGYIPPDSIEPIAEALDLSRARSRGSSLFMPGYP